MTTSFTTTIFALFLIASLSSSASSQVMLSKFDFNTTPLTNATAGPNGSSVNLNATTDGTGVRFLTSGPDVGVDLVVPSSSLLPSLSSIDLRVEFARNESQAWMFEGGLNSLGLEAGVLKFTFAVQRNPNNDNNPLLVTLQYSGLSVSASGVFHQIRAAYDASTGYAALFVNNSLVDSWQGSAGRYLVWTGVSEFVIGRMLDGSGANFVALGSFAIFNNASIALPVELVSFSALKRADAVELRWNTATELNNFGFEIERSFDAKNWEVLNFVNGHGTVNSPRAYSFRDESVLRSNRPVVHYRLRQIDRDGTTDYSSTIEVTLDASNGFSVHPAFPNPFNPSTTFSVKLSQDERVTVRIADASGRTVATILDDEMLSEGVHNLSFHADNLPSGVYFATVRTSTHMGSIKLLLQK